MIPTKVFHYNLWLGNSLNSVFSLGRVELCFSLDYACAIRIFAVVHI